MVFTIDFYHYRFQPVLNEIFNHFKWTRAALLSTTGSKFSEYLSEGQLPFIKAMPKLPRKVNQDIILKVFQLKQNIAIQNGNYKKF